MNTFCTKIAARIIFEGQVFCSFSIAPIKLSDEDGNPIEYEGFDAFRTCNLVDEIIKLIGGIAYQYAGNRTITLFPKGKYAVQFASTPVYYMEGSETVETEPSLDELTKAILSLPDDYFETTDTGYPIHPTH